jgi:hypothetical protein
MTKSLALLLIPLTLLSIVAASRTVATQMPPGRGSYERTVSNLTKEAYAFSGESGNVAVFAANTSSGTKAYLGARCCAGDFYGDVYVHGNMKVDGGKNFVIDNPLDPANKYLYHASVESSEMKNLYDGVVTLDADGRANVRLPEWFGALNKDFRYQLTAIGGPAPGLHVAAEVSNNQFRIAGGPPGLKVSWLVTGVRDDVWAKAHPMQIEAPKPEAERGRYLYPEGWGQPAAAGLEPGRYSGSGRDRSGPTAR